LLTDWDEMSNLYKGPSKDASHQVSVHLAKRFQRRRILEIDCQKQELPMGDIKHNNSLISKLNFVPTHICQWLLPVC
jgi:hypothetical protein